MKKTDLFDGVGDLGTDAITREKSGPDRSRNGREKPAVCQRRDLASMGSKSSFQELISH
ncbi:Isocitrate dehydrogenase [NAD] catalytic subunit 6, mitochondrial [Senna tora]|uniref:Isocitrate dehydrogenase [NAD] catalytic subunit 6, mitochondrial n=1 Tax=Senna tora TaxID=362788 RepID=A0A834SH83_9FABA|nr:Isocitrate dehydrogenase [NAD] catalytic subunit 6, mitochondrial [Senna tora]